jgi:exocyst complex protein 7
MATVVSGNNQALDTAQADLQLLHQNLANSRRVTTKATALLSQFDDRLARLEKTVSGIHKDTLPVQRVHANIHALLDSIDSMLAQSDSLDKEEVVIAKGPRLNHLDAYKDSLARLIDSFEQTKRSAAGNKDSEAMLKRLDSTIEMGAQQLGQIMLGWVREASPADLQRMTSISRPLLDKILSLSEFISVMPDSCSGALSAQRELQRSYADIRGHAVATCLQTMGRDLLKQAKSSPSTAPGIESLVDAIFSSAKVRWIALLDIIPRMPLLHRPN